MLSHHDPNESPHSDNSHAQRHLLPRERAPGEYTAGDGWTSGEDSLDWLLGGTGCRPGYRHRAAVYRPTLDPVSSSGHVRPAGRQTGRGPVSASEDFETDHMLSSEGTQVRQAQCLSSPRVSQTCPAIRRHWYNSRMPKLNASWLRHASGLTGVGFSRIPHARAIATEAQQ